MIVNKEDEIHLVYKKTKDFQNLKYVNAFITKIHSIDPENVIDFLVERFLISKNGCFKLCNSRIKILNTFFNIF